MNISTVYIEDWLDVSGLQPLRSFQVFNPELNPDYPQSLDYRAARFHLPHFFIWWCLRGGCLLSFTAGLTSGPKQAEQTGLQASWKQTGCCFLLIVWKLLLLF